MARYVSRTRKSLLEHRARLERTLSEARTGKSFEHLSSRERQQVIDAAERRLESILRALAEQQQT